MAVQKVIAVSGRYISGHGPSQVTEIHFTGGNTKEMRFEQRGKDKVLTIHGADELEAFLGGVTSLELPIHGVAPDEPAKDEDKGEAPTSGADQNPEPDDAA